MFEDISGHKQQLEFLASTLAKGKLAHGYTFAGPQGVGKKKIALALAYELLGSHKEFHPDLLLIDGKEGIKIEQVRELVYKLSLKPYQAQYKVAIIHEAENLTSEAANALLKSLEEPKPYNVIILVTSNPNRLPKTILSRTQKINFGFIDQVSEETEESIRAEDFYKVFANGELIEKLVTAYEIADLETVEIKNLLDRWAQKLQTELRMSATKKIAAKISQVIQSRRLLDQNVNAKLLLTNLMLNT